MTPFGVPLPSPIDSTAYFHLDLNNDSKADLRIKLQHYQQKLTHIVGHCGILNIKTIQVNPLKSSGFIIFDPDSYMRIRNYRSIEAVIANISWKKEEVIVLIEGDWASPYVSFNGIYPRLNLDDMTSWIPIERLTNNGLKIKEFAYNTT
ncbi:MAG TPA: hypothetical protein PK990_05845 [Salinivirgaceae bacterium]|nr:hypothetical protein [Salinivirgaceae bacterium]